MVAAGGADSSFVPLAGPGLGGGCSRVSIAPTVTKAASPQTHPLKSKTLWYAAANFLLAVLTAAGAIPPNIIPPAYQGLAAWAFASNGVLIATLRKLTTNSLGTGRGS